MIARLGNNSTSRNVTILCMALLLLNLAFLSKNYFGDGLTYAAEVESGDLESLPHPHHLLYNFAGFLFFKLWVLLGYQGRAITALQALNAVAGALGAGVVLLILLRITQDTLLAVFGALGVAFSYGYWYFSLNPGVDILSSLFEFCTFYLLLRSIDETSVKWWGLIGVTHAFAILFHQINILLSVLIVVTLLSSRRQIDEKLRALALYGITVAILVGVPYLVSGIAILGRSTLDSFVSWMVSYAKSGNWWSFHVNNLLKDAYALARVFVGELFIRRLLLGDRSPGTLVPSFSLMFFAAALTLLGVLLAVHWRHFLSKHRKVVLLCLGYAVPYAIYFTVWVPGMYRFWVRLLLPIWIVLSLVVLKLKERSGTLASTLAAAVILMLFSVNFFGAISPQSSEENVEALAYTNLIMDYADSDDMIILPYGGGIGKGLFFKYFYGIKPTLLNRALGQPEEFKQEIDRHLALGHDVFLASDNVKFSSWSLFGTDREELDVDIEGLEVQRVFSNYDMSVVATYDGRILGPNQLFQVQRKAARFGQ